MQHETVFPFLILKWFSLFIFHSLFVLRKLYVCVFPQILLHLVWCWMHQAREQHNTRAFSSLSGHWVYIRWQNPCWIFQYCCYVTGEDNSWCRKPGSKTGIICHFICLNMRFVSKHREENCTSLFTSFFSRNVKPEDGLHWLWSFLRFNSSQSLHNTLCFY